jgi:hypothetical protein
LVLDHKSGHLSFEKERNKERPVLVAQLVVLVIFVGFTFLAAKRFRIETARAA